VRFLGLSSQSKFEYYFRFPSEDITNPRYIYESQLLGATPKMYFRDWAVGVAVRISSPSDGEGFTCGFIRPDGIVYVGPTLTYYDEFDGKQKCWVSSDPFVSPVCGWSLEMLSPTKGNTHLRSLEGKRSGNAPFPLGAQGQICESEG